MGEVGGNGRSATLKGGRLRRERREAEESGGVFGRLTNDVGDRETAQFGDSLGDERGRQRFVPFELPAKRMRRQKGRVRFEQDSVERRDSGGLRDFGELAVRVSNEPAETEVKPAFRPSERLLRRPAERVNDAGGRRVGR